MRTRPDGPVMDDFEALDRSAQVWRDALAVLPEDLSADSYIETWTLADLVNHVHGGGIRYRMYVEGPDPELVQATRTADHTVPSPVEVFDASQKALRDALAPHPGETVPHPALTMSTEQLLRLRCLELTVHAWDIAKSVSLDGVEVCPMPLDLAQWVATEMVDSLAGLRGQGYFVEPVGEPLDDQRAELLRLCGRG